MSVRCSQCRVKLLNCVSCIVYEYEWHSVFVVGMYCCSVLSRFCSQFLCPILALYSLAVNMHFGYRIRGTHIRSHQYGTCNRNFYIGI